MSTILLSISVSILLVFQTCVYSIGSELTAQRRYTELKKIFNKIDIEKSYTIVKEITDQDIKNDINIIIDPHINYLTAHSICSILFEALVYIPESDKNPLFNRFIAPCITFYEQTQKALPDTMLNDSEKQKKNAQMEVLKTFAKNLLINQRILDAS